MTCIWLGYLFDQEWSCLDC